ncbi:MAG: sigma-70 family RNA polymerase sigma factor [Bacteroidales bacterium]|jgi:RNA polymerase sigma-70 factor (ECF subfamily)|nr:sigma-70 family RNA polymerase sigma factor [Bacteroidales bacterium]HOI32657.1 sigma-70 family RNA polymerase sigma factor [Bacteroidales bacterium]
MEQEDQIIIRKVLAGETAAYGVLVEKYQDMVMNIAYQVLRQREEAEDLAQNSFVKAFQKLNTFKGESKFSTWLYRIAWHMAISQHRKLHNSLNSNTFYLTDDNLPVADDAIIEASDREEALAILEKALRKLDAEERVMLNMYYKQQLKVQDISEITGLSQSNVKVKLFRSRKKLALHFETTSKANYLETNTQ